MNAIENLYAKMIQRFPNTRVTTKQVANEIGLTRGVTSSYLSKLEKQGKLEKYGTRPVYWQVKRDKTEFDSLIGSSGSLEISIKHAIEAIVYPNAGLPIYIVGAQGTGKRLFTNTIFNEAIRRHVFTNESVFKSINCEHYRKQSDLLRRNIKDFIYKITQIPSSKGGYLYIENLQVLGSIEHDRLFDLITNHQNDKIRYIFSTTETKFNSEHIFIKNTAMKISLLPINKRPLYEQISFITMFLQREANQIKRNILISSQELIKLAKLNKEDNLRGLDNKIRLLVASAYAESLKTSRVIIGKNIDNTIKIVPNEHSLESSITKLAKNILQINSCLNNLLLKLTQSLANGEPITEQNFYLHNLLKRIDSITSETLLNSLSQISKDSVDRYITKVYGVEFPQDNTFWNQVALAFIISNIFSDSLSVDDSKYNLRKELQKRYPRSYYLYKQFLVNAIPQYFKSTYYLLPFFLLMAPCIDKIESIRYNAVLLAHGDKTATSIQRVANTLCGNYLFEAFDMPMDISSKEINNYVKDYLGEQGYSANGNIVLFDMGSLQQVFKEIKRSTNKELLVINNITTAMVLDIGIQVQRSAPFLSIAEASEKYGSTTKAQYFEGLSNKKNIIVSCMSGAGLSNELKKLIKTTLSSSLEVIILDYRQLYNLLVKQNLKLFSKTKLILTTTDITVDLDIEILNVYNIFDTEISLKLKSILLNAGESQQSSNLLIEKLLQFLSIEGIRDRLQILNPNIVIKNSQIIVSRYEKFYNVKFDSRLKLNLYMHLSLMIERIIMNCSNSNYRVNKSSLDKQVRDFFSLSSGILRPIEKKFNIKVQDNEIELIYQLLKDFISNG